MKKILILSLVFLTSLSVDVQAGNPDRQGEAGAYELLLNPWARNSGLHGLVTGNVKGIESMRINVAGLAYTNKTELVFARTNYLQSSGVHLNAFGFSQRISKKGVFGIAIMSVDFGEIELTTTDQPEGIGANYKPTFFNLGVSYAHQFSERISGGMTIRLISESVSNVSSQGVAFDAGIQYRTGNLSLGISLRNVGTPMKFSGDGFAQPSEAPTGSNITLEYRAAKFELPSLLNIGAAYDFKMAEDKHRMTVMANFTSNSFSKDQYGLGLEYSFKDMFMARVGYKFEDGIFNNDKRTNVHTGLAAGLTVEVPLKKESETRLGIDYSYRATEPFSGTHSFGLRFAL